MFPKFESLNPSDDSNETVKIIKLQKHLIYTMHPALLVAWLYRNRLKILGLRGQIYLRELKQQNKLKYAASSDETIKWETLRAQQTTVSASNSGTLTDGSRGLIYERIRQAQLLLVQGKKNDQKQIFLKTPNLLSTNSQRGN